MAEKNQNPVQQNEVAPRSPEQAAAQIQQQIQAGQDPTQAVSGALGNTPGAAAASQQGQVSAPAAGYRFGPQASASRADGAPEQAAAQIQQQIQAGMDVAQAINSALGVGRGDQAGMQTGGAQDYQTTATAAQAGGGAGADPDAGAFMQLMYEQASELDAVERVQEGMNQLANQSGKAAQEAGQQLEQVGEAAQGTGRRIVNVARDFAMEVSDALFGGRDEKEDREKI